MRYDIFLAPLPPDFCICIIGRNSSFSSDDSAGGCNLQHYLTKSFSEILALFSHQIFRILVSKTFKRFYHPSGRVYYSCHTLTTYMEQAVMNNLSAIQVWQRDLANGPRDSKTVYRWLKRLRSRLPLLLPLLKQELVILAPSMHLTPLQNFILHAAPELSASSAAPPPAMLKPSGLVPVRFPALPTTARGFG
ncbi:MAG: hypothetical protein ONB46_01495 [candidate division KSB1 bacterium]|nr:hypothetical protein [candidate division KSB1 bacterium]MDZ7364340.1 hypothetical protein [candidate division KSB1 bacterium]MDZ7402712.1 hypothetical protein [candidate division KSB1 bacterium]